MIPSPFASSRCVAAALLLLALGPAPVGGGGADRPLPSVPGGAASPDTVADARLQGRIDAYVEPLLSAGDLSGTLLVARGDRILYERSFGMASHELGVPNGPDTRFNVASVTKPLTRIATLLLVEEGRLALDDGLARWIPDFPRGDEITVEHLLEHRSGIPHRVTGDAEVFRPYTASEMAEKAAGADLLFPPGSERGYSSAGYSVLARVLELASGESYADLLDRLVLRPAGAVRSASPRGWALISRRADAYRRGGAELIRAEPANLTFLVGAGSLYSTPRDLFRVVRRIVEGGYGRRVRAELAEDGALSWNGITYGYRAFVDHRSSGDVTVVFAGNLFTGAVDLLRDGVPRIVAGEEPEPPDVPGYRRVVVPAETRRAVEGVYQLRPGAPDSEEELRFSPDGARASLGGWILVPTSEERFLSPQDYATVDVVRDDGAVTGLRWRNGGDTVVFPKVRDLDGR